MRVVIFSTPTEPVLKVLVVLVRFRWLLTCNIALLASVRVDAERTWCHVRYSGCAAIANEVAFIEQLD